MSSPLLAVKGVSVAFAGVRALDDVSMDVAEQEVVSIIGPNGAGKTTLFNVICGFVRPTIGTVEFGGAVLRPRQPSQRARLGVARTLQGVNLWKGMTVIENVMAGGQPGLRAGLLAALLGTPRSYREEVALRQRAGAMLDRLGIADIAARLPGTLPYGVQKRVAIARALMGDPVLLLLDEPASGLGADDIDDMVRLIGELSADMAVMLVEHHMDFVMSISERIVVLNFGRVIASGVPDEIRADPEVTAAYLGADVTTKGVGPG